MNVYCGLRFAIETFVSLKRYEDMVSDSVCFKDDVCRGELFDSAFDIFDHFRLFLCGLAKL